MISSVAIMSDGVLEGSCPHKECTPPVLVDVSLTRGPDLACAVLIVVICLIAFFGRFEFILILTI